MPAPNPIESAIAEAVAASLAAATFQGAITAVPAVFAEYADPAGEEFSTLKAYVSPGELTIEAGTRGADRHEVITQILIGKRCTSDAERRDMRVLQTQIADMIRRGALPAASPAMPANVSLVSLQPIAAPGRDMLGMDVWLVAIGVQWMTILT
ncbi:MAG: hypothetical protein EBR86_16870 [Planctomycetia bacterium]|nr:hypothetical protein [Planctomycetia bacterium]